MRCSFKGAALVFSLVSLGIVFHNFRGINHMTSQRDPPSLQNLLTNQAQSAKSSLPTSKVTLGEARKRNKPATLRERSPYRILAAECIMPSGAKSNWRQVPERDLETIRSKPASSVKSCEKRGDALVFHLNLLEAKKATGFAYEMPFPRYIVADESGSWRSTRSTLQLFHVDDKQQFHPMGPAHSNHADIAEKGDGAFSHWRHTITSGPWCKSMLRFSTPKNVPLKKVRAMVAVVFPMVPPFGWIEFNRGKHVVHQEVFRELFLQTFPTAGVARPHLIDAAEDTIPNTRYVWRVGGNHEFELPLKDGELYEKRLPYQIVEWYEEFERRGGVLYPPPGTYLYYQNKVGLARLFIERKVKIPPTWVITSAEEAKLEKDNIRFPVVIKDPYGFSSLGLLQAANTDEFVEKMQLYFSKALPDVEAIVQSKVIALKEARVTYVDGRPFHGYWRIRQSLNSASAASNLGGFQDFNFPLDAIAPYVAEFANRTGIPVGGVDFIWEEEDADVKTMPYTLEVSPTSDINPPAPLSWHKTYSEFKHTSGYRKAYLEVRRQWTEFMVLAVIDRYRRERRHLFVDIDNVVSLSMDRVRRWRGDKNAYKASEVMKDVPVPGAADALRRLREQYFIRFLTARGSYEDPFNVTQTWLDLNDFEYDDLIVVDRPQSKVCHLTPETILVDDFTQGHEKEEPSLNQKFMDKLSAAKLPFVRFPLGGSWEEIMPQLVR